MREVSVQDIKSIISESFKEMAFSYTEDVTTAFSKAFDNEGKKGKEVFELMQKNMEIAKVENIPLCQDTGVSIVFLTIGQKVAFVGGDLNNAIQEGIAEAYTECYLRYSMVVDPVFKRENTNNNTPAMIHYEIVAGNQVVIEMMAKGCGSENVSKVVMLKPTVGAKGIKEFVVDCVREAGPNACPPMFIGIGIGGTMDVASTMAKKALFRDAAEVSSDDRYAKLEQEILAEINRTNIGPAGLKGVTTAFSVAINYTATHIASLPVAVNICCHANRKRRVVL